ncbi:MAG: ribosome maturation factor RimM [Acidobacteria bacterium]|nr:ribosome maturation factor RimM [Acidobacteriota bacterium]
MSAVPELLLGWVKRLRGVKGELAVATRSQDLTPYLALREARFVRGDAPPELRTLESVRTHGSRLLIRLEGVDSAAAAAPWLGAEMWVDTAVLPALEPGAYYAYQLLGMEVVCQDGERLGRLSDIRTTGGCDLWVVLTPGGVEHLIPAALAICTSVDRQKGLITVNPPVGLLELNAI